MFDATREISSIAFTVSKAIPTAILTRSCMGQTRMRKMMLREKDSRNGDLISLQGTKHEPTSLISRLNLLQRLKRNREARSKFVESHLDKSIAFQIRSLRDKEEWTQEVFAQKLGIKHRNNVSARLENPNYGNHSLRTLKKIAATCDVALVVWFVPFSRLLDWVTGTPHIDNGLSEAFYDIPSFDRDNFGPDAISLGFMPHSLRDGGMKRETEDINILGVSIDPPPKLKRPPMAALGDMPREMTG